jgi:uncharacterized SAM-binding protein YcdF (DUF218 family)
MLLSIQFLIRRAEFLLYPFTWVIILLLLALFTYNQQRRKRLLIWSICLLVFFSNSVIVDELIRTWEVEVILTGDIDPSIRTAILLGGGVYHDKESGKIKYGTNADRYLSVLEPYREGVIDKILVSGGPANYLEPWAKEAEIIKGLYLLCGLPEEHILIEDKSLNTHENAMNSKAILEKLGEKKFLLITSSLHMRRAIACFKKQGIQVQPYSAMKMVGVRRWELDYMFVPSLDNFSKWRSLIHEWIGYLSYKVRGYV